ncbi:MAG: GNAT family N-acetyltransferase [Phycisphaerales bacterium]|nr:GNAT family N-acetyltransferase [Phycisphaerales bacterium]
MQGGQSSKHDGAPIVLRRATGEDSRFLLELRNDPDVVATTSTQRVVAPEEHCAWFESAVSRPDVLILIVEHPEAEGPVGYVRFQNGGSGMAEISIALVSGWRGRSLGTSVISLGCLCAMNEWSDLEQVLAFVRSDNMASVRAFDRAGFALDQDPGMSREGHVVLSYSRPRPGDQ